jgi:hypothetical protein
MRDDVDTLHGHEPVPDDLLRDREQTFDVLVGIDDLDEAREVLGQPQDAGRVEMRVRPEEVSDSPMKMRTSLPSPSSLVILTPPSPGERLRRARPSRARRSR